MKMIARIRTLTAALALLLCLSACGTDGESGESTTTTASDTVTTTESTAATTTTAPLPTALTVVEEGKSSFEIIRSEEASDAVKKSSIALVQSIREKTGTTIKLASDWYNPRGEVPAMDGFEILVGETNRPESAEVKASLPEHGYAIVMKNNKLVILGTDTNMTTLALYAFEEKILSDPAKCADGKLVFEESDSMTVTMDGALTTADLIDSGYTITASSKKLVQTNKQGEYGIGQGSCSDGTYVYFVLRNSKDTGSVITKHRLDDGSFVAVSDVLDLGHGNDMTFDTKNRRLVVAHGQSEGKILTLVDPDTLAFIKDINIPKGSGAITYSVAKDRYAISQGGSSLHILTADFEWVVSYSRSDKADYTPQGMGSDEDYIYFPMSGSKDNVLVVYDWDGKYITTITVPVDHEAESMFWVNDRYYVAYNTAGEALYETVFEIVYE